MSSRASTVAAVAAAATAAKGKGRKGHKSQGGEKKQKRGHIREVKGTFNKHAKHDNSLRNHTVPRSHDQTSALAQLVPALFGKNQRASRGFVETLSSVMHAIINEVGQQVKAHTLSSKTVKRRHIEAVLGTLLVDSSMHHDVLHRTRRAYAAAQVKEQASRSKKQTKRASTKE